MKKMIVSLAAVVLIAVYAGELLAEKGGAGSTEENWIADFEQAKRLAAEQQQPILANFSGSDWCGWCIKLDREVFSKQAFQDYAEDSLVLFLADFPTSKTLPPEQVKQNRGLAERYGVRGFPTILLLDAEGNVLARTGYVPGGPDNYVQHLKGLIQDAAEAHKG